MPRIPILLTTILLLAGCGGAADLEDAPVPLGNFALGHNVVVTPNIVKGPASRAASDDEWIAAMTKAVEDRFGRYEGARLYHFGISVEGYVLAQPGIPVVLSPKSVLIFRLTVWDDAAGEKLNPEPHEITVLESLSTGTIVGSGLTQTREQQLENLSVSAAKEIERWLVRQNFKQKWFGAAPAADPAATAEAGRAVDVAAPAPGGAADAPAVVGDVGILPPA